MPAVVLKYPVENEFPSLSLATPRVSSTFPPACLLAQLDWQNDDWLNDQNRRMRSIGLTDWLFNEMKVVKIRLLLHFRTPVNLSESLASYCHYFRF
jgi:hypothetical protein